VAWETLSAVAYGGKPSRSAASPRGWLLSTTELLPGLLSIIADFLTMPISTITFNNRSLTPTRLQQVIDYINTHLDQDLSLVQIAGVINISPTYFASLFKHATGISPRQYVIKQRVERAKLLLSKTDLMIADIALEVGFSSQSHLNQHFKRLTSMTPKQIRPSL
jgi:AraC family transcriptional regulator